MPSDGITGEIDNSDVVVPVELPNWHIESKSTKSPKIPASKLKAWASQIKEDCPPGKVAVILTVANGYSPIAIMPVDVYKAVARQISSLTVSVEASFSPAPELIKLEKAARLYGTLISKPPPPFTGAIASEPELGTIMIAINAVLWLAWAFEYEAKLRHVKDDIGKDLKSLDAENSKLTPKLELVK